MRNALYTITFVGLVGTGFYMGLGSIANMPDVHMSYSTNECIEVINYDERFEYTCETLPEKYNHIWVK